MKMIQLGLSRLPWPSALISPRLFALTDCPQINIDCSIGVTTGKAFCGAVGSTERREYAVVGDIVNLSARLMGKADEVSQNKILVDNATYLSTRKSKVCTYTENVELRVKGKKEPVVVWTPAGAGQEGLLRSPSKMLPSSRSGPASGTHLVGRSAELKYLEKLIDWTRSRQGSHSRFILIDGDPGTGKSKILSECARRALTKNVHFLSGSATPLEKDTPYFALRDAFGPFLPSRNPAERRSFVEATFAENPEMLPYLPLVSRILTLDLTDNEITAGLKGIRRADRTNELLMWLLLHRNYRLLFFDNGEWLDSATWAFIQMLTETACVACVVAMRIVPVTVPPQPHAVVLGKLKNQEREEAFLQSLNEGRNEEHSPSLQRRLARSNETKTEIRKHEKTTCKFHRMTLMPLSGEDVAILARQCFKAWPADAPIPPEMQEELGTAEGNPMMIEEIVGRLKEDGQLVIDQNAVRFVKSTQKAENTVHNTMRGLISSKIDNLSEPQQTCLKIASGIGRSFTMEVLAAIYPDETEEEREFKKNLDAELDKLVERNFFILEGNVYMFKQLLMQDVAYEMILHKYRIEIHARIASWYEETYKADLSPYWTLLGYHWKQAGEKEKAMHYLDLAGSLALRNHANREALNIFTEILELSDWTDGEADRKLPRAVRGQLIEWLRKIGQAHYNLGDFAEADRKLKPALGLLREPLPSGRATALGQNLRNKFTESVGLGNTSLARVYGPNSRHEAVECIRCLLYLTQINYYSCQKSIATYCSLRALSVVQGLSPVEAKSTPLPELSLAIGNCILTAGFKGKADEVHNYVWLLNQYRIPAEDSAGYMHAQHCLGIYNIGIGNLVDAGKHLNNSIEIANQVQDMRQHEEASLFLADLHFYTGEVEESEAMLVELIESSGRRGDVHIHVLAIVFQTRNYYMRRDIGLLQKMLELIDAESLSKAGASAQMMHSSLSALYQIERGNIEESYQLALQTREMIKNTEPTAYFTSIAYYSCAEVFMKVLASEWRKSDSKEDRQFQRKLLAKLTRAISLCESFATLFPIFLPALSLLKGRIELANSKNSRAIKLFQIGLEKAQKLDLKYEIALAYFLLSVLDGDEITKGEKKEYTSEAAERFALLNIREPQLLLPKVSPALGSGSRDSGGRRVSLVGRLAAHTPLQLKVSRRLVDSTSSSERLPLPGHGNSDESDS